VGAGGKGSAGLMMKRACVQNCRFLRAPPLRPGNALQLLGAVKAAGRGGCVPKAAAGCVPSSAGSAVAAGIQGVVHCPRCGQFLSYGNFVPGQPEQRMAWCQARQPWVAGGGALHEKHPWRLSQPGGPRF
jgi:hypothetical protein